MLNTMRGSADKEHGFKLSGRRPGTVHGLLGGMKWFAAVSVLACGAWLIFPMSGRLFLISFGAAILLTGQFVLLLEERKKLRLSGSLLSIMTKTTGGCCWEWSAADRRFRLTPGGLPLFGKEVETYDDLISLIHPDDVNRFKTAMDRFSAAEFPSEEPFEVEFRIQSVQEEWRWFVARGSAQSSPETASRIMGSMVDIDAYKRAVEAMRASERRLVTIFNSAPGSMAVTDKDGNLIDANQAFYD
ncbi:MAG: PAS domain-containing protein, partial [Synergistaceae bacterium]|nr:PAS domain-containing protein [Synergistaceae bacterium]